MKHRFELHKVKAARALIRRRLMELHRQQRRAEGKIAALIQEERRWLGDLHRELRYREWEDSWLRRPRKQKYHDWEEKVGRPSRSRRSR